MGDLAACCSKPARAGRRQARIKTKPRLFRGGVCLYEAPGDDLLLHACAHYHRRGCVSLPSSGWDRVVPQRYGHQGDGWRVAFPIEVLIGSRTLSRLVLMHFTASANWIGSVASDCFVFCHRRVEELMLLWTVRTRMCGLWCTDAPNHQRDLRLYGQATRIISTR